MAIKSFKGKNAFLSNFSTVFVYYNGIKFPTVEHAFQAAKTLDSSVQAEFPFVPTPADARYYGRRVALRADWNAVKDGIMEDLLRQKFNNPVYKKLLLSTGDEYIEEGNTHGDTYWGTVRGKGENRLGKLIMKIREELGSDDKT